MLWQTLLAGFGGVLSLPASQSTPEISLPQKLQQAVRHWQ